MFASRNRELAVAHSGKLYLVLMLDVHIFVAILDRFRLRQTPIDLGP